MPAHNTLSEKYSLIRWVVYTFLGGAINTVSYLLFAQFYTETIRSMSQSTLVTDIVTGYAQMIVFASLVIALPMILSIIFSKFNPELQLVSPFNMQIVSFGWLLYYLYTQNNLQFGILLILGVSTIFTGFAQDAVARDLVGLKADKNDILTTSLIVETELSKLQSILLTQTFRKNLGLGKRIEETKEGIILKSTSDAEYQTVILLTKGEDEKKTYLDMAVFEKGKYALELTDDLKEFAKEHREKYLKAILRKSLVKYAPLSKSHAEKLRDQVTDMLKGRVMQVQNVPAGSLIKILGVSGLLTLCSVGYFEKWFALDVFLGVLIPTIVYALFEFFPTRRGKGE